MESKKIVLVRTLWRNNEKFSGIFLSSFLSSQIRKIAAAWSNYFFFNYNSATTTLQLQLFNYNSTTTTLQPQLYNYNSATTTLQLL